MAAQTKPYNPKTSHTTTMLKVQEEALRCLLCHDAPCSKACTPSDPARAVRAARFQNLPLAARIFRSCSEEDLENAEKACIHYDSPIRLSEMARSLMEQYPAADEPGDAQAPSLEIDFCGIHCENPFFLASSAVCTGYEMIASAFKAGWAGVFYKTISSQDIREVSPRFDTVNNASRHGEFIGFRNMEQLSENSADTDFDILARLKKDFPTKVVIASIMGGSEEEWGILAKRAEDAGLDAVELNFSCPQMRSSGLGSDIGQNPELIALYTAYVKSHVSIPVIPKMTPNVMHMGQAAMASFIGGASAISAINTIKSITMNPEAEVSGKRIVSGYSGRAVKPIALRMIYEIATSPLLEKFPLSGIGGIETWKDAVEFIQLGCSNVQVCTAVMQYGYRIIDDLRSGLQGYMRERGISSLCEIVGEELPNFVSAGEVDRETIIFPVIDKNRCIGCGRCYISCQDGGHQALSFSPGRVPQIIGSRCVGCHLCRLVCPTEAIKGSKRVKKRAKATPAGC